MGDERHASYLPFCIPFLSSILNYLKYFPLDRFELIA